jgi:hypothetical protein
LYFSGAEVATNSYTYDYDTEILALEARGQYKYYFSFDTYPTIKTSEWDLNTECSASTLDEVVTADVTISGLVVTIPIPKDSLYCDKEFELLKSDLYPAWSDTHHWNSFNGVLTLNEPGTYYYFFYLV